jgi:hypothetical protein
VKPTPEAIVARLDAAVLEDHRPEPPRAYIGASGIGNPCTAYHALCARGFPNQPLTPQQIETFAEGHRVEPLIVAKLRRIGAHVIERDPSTGKQWAYFALGGHVRAHLDGIIDFGDGDHGLLECKTMARKFFDAFKKKGLRGSHPEYIDQMILGMGLSGLRWGLMAALCKDNSQMRVEYVPFDQDRFNVLLDRATTGLLGSPLRYSAEEKSSVCFMCFKRDACWKGVSLAAGMDQESCRTCRHAQPIVCGDDDQRSWRCTLHNQPASHRCGDYAVFRVIPIAPAAKPKRPRARAKASKP